jgi:hypothetical protein
MVKWGFSKETKKQVDLHVLSCLWAIYMYKQYVWQCPCKIIIKSSLWRQVFLRRSRLPVASTTASRTLSCSCKQGLSYPTNKYFTRIWNYSLVELFDFLHAIIAMHCVKSPWAGFVTLGIDNDKFFWSVDVNLTRPHRWVLVVDVLISVQLK